MNRCLIHKQQNKAARQNAERKLRTGLVSVAILMRSRLWFVRLVVDYQASRLSRVAAEMILGKLFGEGMEAALYMARNFKQAHEAAMKELQQMAVIPEKKRSPSYERRLEKRRLMREAA